MKRTDLKWVFGGGGGCWLQRSKANKPGLNRICAFGILNPKGPLAAPVKDVE